MSDVAIRIENLSKQYRIGRLQQRHDSLQEMIMAGVRAPLNRFRQNARATAAPDEETIWALRDVSFSVKPGEVVGIIGRNGAGKSTLLKILSQITEPTFGQAVIHGRVNSLLEVGTGFHPELTGRENIYFNGAILGMKKAEIDRKFDEIVDFSGVEKFIDTPVKRYSSGMKVRLAFSVAAHLEPEILLVDEVLAVGDAAFQRKCLGKMEDVAQGGRTVLFVSHNMGAVQTLCRRGIFLHNSSVHIDSSAAEAVRTYLKMLEQAAPRNLAERTDRRGKGQVRLAMVEIFDANGLPSTNLITGGQAQFRFHLNKMQLDVSNINVDFTIYDDSGQSIVYFSSAVSGSEDLYDPTIGSKAVCEIDELLLVPGRYRINVALYGNGEMQDHVEGVTFFDV
ncbi:MAG: ABC transporter ATP-binding protein, partial [Anaerolineae bacterium]